MKLCIVGIGGAGGKITQEFLGNEDLTSGLLSRLVDSEYLSPAKIKGIWLEADKNDAKSINAFFGDLKEGAYPGFFIPHDSVEDGCPLHVRVKQKYGYDVKKQGFVRDAQYLKAIFDIFDTDPEIQQIAAGNGGLTGTSPADGEESNQADARSGFRQMPNPIFDSAWEVIRDYTTLGLCGGECDGILFIVSFGGGTGTGFINPIINHIRNEGKADYPVLAVGVLTELGEFTDKAQGTTQERRNLAAISAIYDLLTNNKGANGVILIDNQILLEMFKDKTSANRFIHKIMQPMVAARDYPGEQVPAQAIAQNFSQGLSRTPLFVPFYWSAPRRPNPEEELVSRALKEGKLFGCALEKADYAAVFCRGFVDSEKIRQAISAKTGLPNNEESIWVLRKMGGGNDEILILLQNPYGGDPEAYRKEGTLENRLYEVIKQALDYITQNPENLFYRGKEDKEKAEKGEDVAVKLTADSEKAISRFFFGKEGCERYSPECNEGFVFQLMEARRKLQAGEKPFFYYPLRIFEKEKADPDKKEEKMGPDIGLNEKRIREIVDQRVEERLAEAGIAKR